MKRQGIYWLVNKITPIHESRKQLLGDIGCEVSFFPNVEELVDSLNLKRVSIVIVGDECPEDECVAAINILADLPVIQGARLILSQSKMNSRLCYFASGNGFRDIIPLDLTETRWLARFQFSTASKNDIETLLENSQPAIPPIKMHLMVPARIAWINGEQIWVETRARPWLQDDLKLHGSLADEMGCHGIHLKVSSHQTRNLVYRFSEGMICDWEARSEESGKIGRVIDELRTHNIGARRKVFLAIQSPALRNTILKYLNPEIYAVHTALQKKSLISEPKYFTPELVFIEYRLCEGEAMSRFQEMVNHIPENSTVVVVGAKEENLVSFRNFSSGRRVEALMQIPKNLPELIHNGYLTQPTQKSSDSNIYIPSAHRFSYCELDFEATLVGQENDLIELRTASRLANYGLIRLKQNDTGNEVYGKVVNVRIENSENNLVICQLSNPSSKLAFKARTRRPRKTKA